MHTNKQTLIESINKQRKLMGLTEVMDINTNINAQDALSGNKLDLGVMPLKEMDPEDDDEFDDELHGDQEDYKNNKDYNYYDQRSDDERDFYKGQPPISLDDLSDIQYPDPNERQWRANMYSSDSINEAELDELFGTGIGAGISNAIKGVGQNFKTGRLTKQILNTQNKFNRVIAQANSYLANNEKIFNDLMSYQKTLAQLNANDPNKKSLEIILNSSKATWVSLKNTLAKYNGLINQTSTNTTTTTPPTGTTATPNTTLGQSGTTTGNFKIGDIVTYTDKNGNSKQGKIVDPKKYGKPAVATGYSAVLYQGMQKPVAVSNVKLQTI